MNPETLDQDAVNLAKAIRQTESNGNFKAKGKSGEYGAYQFTTPTWDKTAKKYGVSVPLEQATPEHQNEVAYKQIKEWKDAGYNPGQIASLWNSGKPDAYKDTSYKGVNKYGVTYDVPKYAESVARAYQTIKSGGQVHADPQNPSSIANETPVQIPSVSTAQQTLQPEKPSALRQGIAGVFNSIASPLVGLAALPVQAGVKAYNQLSGKNIPDPYEKGIPGLAQTSTPVSKLGVKEKLGDAAQVASYVTPAKGLGGMISSGALQGAGTKMSQGASGEEVVKSGLLGGGLGLGLGVVGKGVGKLAEKLPERITRAFIPGINEETTKYAASKGLGSYEKMLKESTASIDDLGTSLGKALENPKYAYQAAQGNNILSQVAKSMPDAGLTADDIAENIKRVVPLKAGLVERFRKGSLSLKELQSLNSAIGKNTFKTVFDDPAIKANKEVAANVYHEVSKYIKTNVPESVPFYEALSKEYPLASALEKAIRRGDKSKLVTLRDLFAIFGGGALGPAGSMSAYALNKAIESPSVNLKAAGLLGKLSNPTLKKTAQMSTPFLTKGVLNIGSNQQKTEAK